MRGKITISRPSSGNVSIKIHDNNSGVDFLEVKMSLENFSEALFGLARVDCEFATKELDLIGTTREIKVVNVPDFGGDEISLKPYLVDGWKYVYGWGNHHYKTGDGYNVTFKRNLRKDYKDETE
jgi:hypothetical protein